MEDNQRVDAVAAFHEALELARTQTAFAAAAGISQQLVSNLVRRGDVLPAEAVIPAERAFGVSRFRLRPDIYPPEEAGLVSPASNSPVEIRASDVAFDRPAGMKRSARQ